MCSELLFGQGPRRPPDDEDDSSQLTTRLDADAQTTGTAIFDYSPLSAKTGIASRSMRPLLGIVDPLNTESCSREVHISSGLDVLFHALESWTAIPYNTRVPRPSNPILRPAYQGRNPSEYPPFAACKTVPA